jgi:hypothetical protein
MLIPVALFKKEKASHFNSSWPFAILAILIND